jgi:hypothetical protein
MSIGTPNGILDITGATLRVSKMEFRQSTGFDTVLNNVARNTMLLMDETEQATSNSWALKLPNAWIAEFHGYWASGSSGAPILFNFYNDSTSGTNGYILSMDDTTISINYDGGSALGSATLSSTLNTDAYRKVAIIFERSVLDVSVDGEHVFHFADSQLRDRVYDNNSGYVTFTHSSTDERKLKNLKFTNGDKWVREIDSSNIAYVGGNVGIGTTIPGTKFDVSGTVRGTHLIGDGSAISAIQSSNVSDFGSNVTRIGTLETDLGDNSTRITNLSSNLSDNSSRITFLESGDISISGDKTFTGDIIFESNVHMNSGNVFVANTVNLTVSDPIIELGSNNSGTNDLGIILTRPAANSNVAFVYDESDDILRMGYTLNGASDTVVDLDSNALAVSVQGELTVGSNLAVNGAASATHVSLGTTLYPTLGGNWLTIDSPTFDGDIGDNHPDPDGGILFTNDASNGTLPWGYYMGVVKDVASTLESSQRFDIGKSYDLNSQDSSGGADTLTPYFTIDNGNVGIGITNPSSRFVSYGGALWDGSDHISKVCATLQVGRGGGAGASTQDSGTGAILEFRHHNDYRYVTMESVSEGNYSSHIGLRFKTVDDGVAPEERMRIDAHGNVGIGTTSPGAKLHVESGIGDICRFFRPTSTSGQPATIHLGRNPATNDCAQFRYVYGGSTNSSDSRIDLGFYGNGSILNINANGTVGIGMTNHTRLLEVNGTSQFHGEMRWNLGTNVSHAGYATSKDWYIRSGENAGKVIIQDSGGNVGIGLGTPNDQKVEIEGGLYIRRSGGSQSTSRNYNASKWILLRRTGNRVQNQGPGISFQGSYYRTADYNNHFGMIMCYPPNNNDDLKARMAFYVNDGGGSSIGSGDVAGYFDYDSGGGQVNFTGQHRTFIKDIPITQSELFEGLIVSANQNKYIKMDGGIEAGSNAVTINESLPIVSLSNVATDKKCFGVISYPENSETREDRYGRLFCRFKKERGDTRVYINSVGEGAIWVTNINGNLESGDYITTSNVAGYGMLQDDDILHNYTVAKITMDCDFSPATQPAQQIVKELGNVNYWVETTYSDVTLEEYSKLTEENRRTVTVNETVTYQMIDRDESTTEQEGYTREVRQELVNVLDEHGQLQWEDHPTDTEKAYKIRYLTSDGTQTDEANAVHIAAFVGCTYHCG